MFLQSTGQVNGAPTRKRGGFRGLACGFDGLADTPGSDPNGVFYYQLPSGYVLYLPNTWDQMSNTQKYLWIVTSNLPANRAIELEDEAGVIEPATSDVFNQIPDAQAAVNAAVAAAAMAAARQAAQIAKQQPATNAGGGFWDQIASLIGLPISNATVGVGDTLAGSAQAAIKAGNETVKTTANLAAGSLFGLTPGQLAVAGLVTLGVVLIAKK